MAKQKSCVPDMVEATAGILSEAEAKRLIGEISGKATIRAQEKNISIEEAVREVAYEQKNNIRLSASVAKRNKALQIRAEATINRFVTTTKGKGGRTDWVKNMGQFLENAQQDGNFQGARLISSMLRMLGDKRMMERMRNDEPFQLNVRRELHNLSQDEPVAGGITGDKEALIAARAFFEPNAVAVDKVNLHGGNIRRSPGWAVPQTHDELRIQEAGGNSKDAKERYETSYRAWREWMDRHNIDWDRTLAGENLEEFFREFHRDIYYRHFADDPDVDPSPYTKLGSLSKKVSAERKLWFKDAESEHAYSIDWGKRTLADEMLVHLQQKGRTISLLKHFGPSPDGALKSISNKLAEVAKNESMDPKVVTHFQLNRFQGRMDVLSGRTFSTTNASLSRNFETVKNFNLLTKGANIALTMFGDRVFIATEAMARGVPALDAFGAAIFGRINKSADGARLADAYGLFHQSYMGHVASRWMNQDRVLGPMAGGVHKLYSWTGVNWLNDLHRHIAGDLAAHNVGMNAGKSFNQLDADMKLELESFGITDRDWDLLRSTAWKMDSGHVVISPDNVKNIPVEKLNAELAVRNLEPTLGNQKRLIDELEGKLGVYSHTWVNRSVPTPNLAARSFMTLGGQPKGTWQREMWDLFMVFKGFPIAAAMSMTRNVRGAFAMGHYGKGIVYLSSVIAQSIVAGYVITVAKDAIKGRTPRKLWSDGDVNWDNIVAAGVQGGGLGIYGDFLLSEYDRRTRSPISALAGPVLGTVSDAVLLAQKGIRGAAGDEDVNMESFGYEAFRFGEQNMPFINSFYIKPILDYLIWWHIKEALSPGVITRQQQSVEDKNHQEFWLEPLTY